MKAVQYSNDPNFNTNSRLSNHESPS